MGKQIFGYIRVSTKEQNEARQLDSLACYNIPDRNMYVDKQSGKDFERPAYIRLMKRIRRGDLLVVKSIDRLGRDYNEIIEEWRRITKEKKADILIVDMPLLDTRTKGQDLTGKFIADLVLQILSYVAQTERENIRQRQAEGIASARARGVKFGRPRKVLPSSFERYAREFYGGRLTVKQAANGCGMAPTTFFSYARRLKTRGE